ncbi:MAG: M48 family metallopeptidase [Verrucomicrobiales bacterium]|nr:M48 family metallopeptidase [Verrucomicrobiales bacterium]
MTTKRWILISVIAVACVSSCVWFVFKESRHVHFAGSALAPIVVPKRLAATDFQTVEDARCMEWLEKVERGSAAKSLDTHVMKPLSDDVRTRTLSVEGLEVTKEQFAELYSIVEDCARILQIEKTPRVFVSTHTEYPTVTENYSDSVVIIQANILDRFRHPTELRFLIGRELGHVKAGHTRWNTSVRRAKTLADRFSFLREEGTCLPLMPILQWARQSEMTADNAGLICAQNLNEAERVLVRLATGTDDSATARISVDAYLRQSDTETLSGFSEFMLLWKEWNKPAPFASNRIRQLRQYQESARYRTLWN